MDEWTSGRVDEWTSGRVDEWTSGRVDEWTSGNARYMVLSIQLRHRTGIMSTSPLARFHFHFCPSARTLSGSGWAVLVHLSAPTAVARSVPRPSTPAPQLPVAPTRPPSLQPHRQAMPRDLSTCRAFARQRRYPTVPRHATATEQRGAGVRYGATATDPLHLERLVRFPQPKRALYAESRLTSTCRRLPTDLHG